MAFTHPKKVGIKHLRSRKMKTFFFINTTHKSIWLEGAKRATGAHTYLPVERINGINSKTRGETSRVNWKGLTRLHTIRKPRWQQRRAASLLALQLIWKFDFEHYSAAACHRRFKMSPLIPVCCTKCHELLFVHVSLKAAEFCTLNAEATKSFVFSPIV